VLMMADLSDDPVFISKMWEEFGKGYDVVGGSRFMKNSVLHNYPFLKMVSNRLFNLAVTTCLLPGITDSSNNFKAFRTSKARAVPLNSRGFEVGAELMLRIALTGGKICEIPVSWKDRESGTAKFSLSRVFLNYLRLFIEMLAVGFLYRKQTHGTLWVKI